MSNNSFDVKLYSYPECKAIVEREVLEVRGLADYRRRKQLDYCNGVIIPIKKLWKCTMCSRIIRD